jgi:hypothetical protein
VKRLFVLASILLALVPLIVTAQANTITRADGDRFYSLRGKLRTLASDVTQSMRFADVSVINNCLSFVSNQAHLVEAIAGHVGELITLAAVMRDKDDEFIVLHELRIMIPVAIKSLAGARQIINGAMNNCSDVATVNVKGQALLGVFSEMDNVLRSLSNRVGKDSN